MFQQQINHLSLKKESEILENVSDLKNEISNIESEILKNGGEVVDLSEMWIVRHCYEQKAEKFVRLHGMLNLVRAVQRTT